MGSACEPGKEPLILEIHDRREARSRPVGLAVACPRRGWTPVIRCVMCADFASMSVDPVTSRAVLVCTPAELTVDERAGDDPRPPAPRPKP